MNTLLLAARALAFDFASTLMFAAVTAVSGKPLLGVAVGLALACGQIGWDLRRGRPITALQWTSLFVVAASGGGALLTHDPRLAMLSPTLLSSLVGVAMLQRGWMTRYMPKQALDLMPDLVIAAGYVWAGLMFASAAVNLVLVLTVSAKVWGAAISSWGMASKLTLCVAQIAVMKNVGRRRYRAKNGDRSNIAAQDQTSEVLAG